MKPFAPALALALALAPVAHAQTATVVADINPGAGESFPEELTAVGDLLFFTAIPTGTGARVLYVYDTSTAELTPLATDASWSNVNNDPEFLTGGATLLYFFATTTDHGRELWRSDGTVAGTFRLTDIRPGATSTDFGSSPTNRIVVDGDRAYFHADDGGVTSGREPWTSDGSVVGTEVLLELKAGTTGSSPSQLTVIDGRLYLFADSVDNFLTELQIWDGADLTTNGTARLFGSADPAFWRVDGPGGVKVLGAIDGPDDPGGLYSVGTDGAILPLATTGTFRRGLSAGSRVFFSGPDFELWSSDGVTTERVEDLHPTGSSDPRAFAVLSDGSVCFAADDGTNNVQPWCSDGTEAGTNLLGLTGEPDMLLGFDSKMYIATSTTLFVSDGVAGVSEIDFNLHPSLTGVPRELTVVNGALYMSGVRGDDFGRELVVLCNGCLIDSACVAEDTLNPLNQCEICAPASAAEAWSPNDGASCSDGDLCTEDDLCDASTCEGTPKVCPDPGQCKVATCDSGSGICGEAAVPDDPPTSCDDDDACTQTDVCVAGACEGSSPVTCTALDQCHDVGTCDTVTGVCSDPPKTNGTGCDDDDACTQVDECEAGVCTGKSPVTCTALSQCHDVGTCDPDSGVCDDPPLSEISCDDSNACTQTDVCQDGACVGSNPVTCTALDQCHVAGACDTGTGLCSDPEAPDGTDCTDTDLCSTDSECQSGTCAATAFVTCSALDACHVAGTCDPGTGLCSNPAAPDGTDCTDADLCSTDSECQTGTCTGTAFITCTALDVCHLAGTCNPATGVCSNPNAPSTTTCDDGNSCTDTDRCNNGACVGTAAACNDNDPCTTDSCVDGVGCVNTSGALTCNDDNPCTDDACVPGLGCQFTPNAAPCDDLEICAANDTCAGGVCSGSPVACNDQNPCTHDVCTPGLGCTTTPDDTASCDDANPCTADDHCDGGLCRGTVCPPDPTLGACLTRACTASGCQPRAVSGSCDDADVCTSNDRCQSGQCTGSAITCPDDDGDPCTAPICGPNGCELVAGNDGAACDDGDACTTGDACQDGLCAPGGPRVCPAPSDPCQIATCNEVTGQCESSFIAECGACDEHPALCIHDLAIAGSVTRQPTASTPGEVAIAISNLGPDIALAQLWIEVPDEVFVDFLTFAGVTCALPEVFDPNPLDGMVTVAHCQDVILARDASDSGSAEIDAAAASGSLPIALVVTTVGTDPASPNDRATLSLSRAAGTLGLAVTRRPTSPVPAGELAVVAFDLVNTASTPATDARVAIALTPPSDVTVDAGQGPIACDDGGCVVALPDLSPGAKRTLTLSAPLCQSASLAIDASATIAARVVEASAAIPIQVDGTCGPCAQDPTGCAAELALSAPPTWLTANPLALTVDNDGPDDAIGVELLVDAPLASVALTRDGVATPCPGSAGRFTCPLGVIAPGASWQGALTALAAEAGPLEVALTLTSLTDDASPDDDALTIAALGATGPLQASLTVGAQAAAGVAFPAELELVNLTGLTLDAVTVEASVAGKGRVLDVAPPTLGSLAPAASSTIELSVVGCGPLFIDAAVSASVGGHTLTTSARISTAAGASCGCLPELGCAPSIAALANPCLATSCDPTTLTCRDGALACVAADPCMGATCVAGACVEFLAEGQQASCAGGAVVTLQTAPGPSGTLTLTTRVSPDFTTARALSLTLALEGDAATFAPSELDPSFGPSVTLELAMVSGPLTFAHTLGACGPVVIDARVFDPAAPGTLLGHARRAASLAERACTTAGSLTLDGASTPTSLLVQIHNDGESALPLVVDLGGSAAASVTAASFAAGPTTRDGARITAPDRLLAPGQSETLTLTLASALAGELTLTLPSPHASTALDTLAISGAADLAVSLAPAPPSDPRAGLTLTGTLDNTAASPASGVVLELTLPPLATLASAARDGAALDCTTSPPFTCELGALAANTSLPLTFTLAPAPAQGLSGDAVLSVSSTSLDPTPDNNRAATALSVPGAVAVTLPAASGPGGAPLDYALQLQNPDPLNPLTDLRIALALSGERAAFTTAPAGALVTSGCGAGQPSCAFVLGSLPAGGTRSVPLRLSGCGPLTLTASAALANSPAQIETGTGYADEVAATLELTACDPAPPPIAIAPTSPPETVEAAPGDEVKLVDAEVDNASADDLEITELTLGTDAGAFDEVKVYVVGEDEPEPDPQSAPPVDATVTPSDDGRALFLALIDRASLGASDKLRFVIYGRLINRGASATPGAPHSDTPSPLVVALALVALALAFLRRRAFAAAAFALALASCGDSGSSSPSVVTVELESVKARTADGREVELLARPTPTASIRITR